MNREIKFRVWDNYDRLMYYNVVVGENLIIFNYKVEKSFDSDDELDINLDYDIDLDTYVYLTDENRKYFNIMQYTGLKDKNGKEIYEGDIIKFTDNYNTDIPEKIGVVKFNNASFYITDGAYSCYRWIDINIEIIGNIYENPDLLEDN